MALELAAGSRERVRPNPNVGCVIVHNGEVIGQGFHERYGDHHAEVNAINSVINKELLNDSTLYVTLEPCSHWGKTPPCADLIIRMGIPRVVVGIADPFAEVSGRGTERLRAAGVEVKVGVMERQCRELNRDFMTFHTEKRPYIILKWAQTCDGFLDNDRDAATPAVWITGSECKRLVHKWRSECDAIMVGTNTVERDNPALTVREVEGRDPMRVVIDRTLRLHPDSKVFGNNIDDKSNVLLVTAAENLEEAMKKHPHLTVKTIDFSADKEREICELLHGMGIMTLFIEGGAWVLNSFINSGLWDEMRVFTAPISVAELPGGRNTQRRGTPAPVILPNDSTETERTMINDIELKMIKRL